MWTMASHAARAELALGTLLLGAVAVGARFAHGQSLMRLMTIGADLMPLRRSLLLAAMAVGTCRGLRPGMRFVATGAARVAGFDQARFSLVAVGARDLF